MKYKSGWKIPLGFAAVVRENHFYDIYLDNNI